MQGFRGFVYYSKKSEQSHTQLPPCISTKIWSNFFSGGGRWGAGTRAFHNTENTCKSNDIRDKQNTKSKKLRLDQKQLCFRSEKTNTGIEHRKIVTLSETYFFFNFYSFFQRFISNAACFWSAS